MVADALALVLVLGVPLVGLAAGGLAMLWRPGRFVEADHAVGSVVHRAVRAVDDRWGRRAAEAVVRGVGACLAVGAIGAAVLLMVG